MQDKKKFTPMVLNKQQKKLQEKLKKKKNLIFLMGFELTSGCFRFIFISEKKKSKTEEEWEKKKYFR